LNTRDYNILENAAFCDGISLICAPAPDPFFQYAYDIVPDISLLQWPMLSVQHALLAGPGISFDMPHRRALLHCG
jgi:hypothetical protein